MWCLKQGDQKRDSDRAQHRNLSEKLLGSVLLALRQQLPPCLTTYLHQRVELLIKLLGASTHACFWQLLQPTVTMARRIHFFSSTGNRPASIERLSPIHHAGEIFGHGEIAPAQLS